MSSRAMDATLSTQDKLKFDRNLVIVGGGTVETDLLKQLAAQNAVVIAADGGAHRCEDADVTPLAIIGDMDSLENRTLWEARTQIIEISEQLTTDFEKCLYITEAPLTVVLGMTGKRFDHTLAALSTVTRCGQDRMIALVDECDVALVVSGRFEFSVREGERVSVHPLTPISFEKSEGLVYALDGLTLAMGARGGTSNAAMNGDFSIVPAKGQTQTYMVIMRKIYLPQILAAFGK